MSETLLSVGELARETGVSAQSLRHYETLGLLKPRRTASGYRMYTAVDCARLDVIRTLRELDVDLSTIGRVLRGATSLRAVAELHVVTLDHQTRVLRRRAAVLRASLRRESELDAARIDRLHALARLERAEKARFITDHLGKRMANAAPAPLRNGIIEAAQIELPEDPTPEQLDAWLELAELVSDETFLAHYRKQSPMNAAAASRWQAQVRAVHADVAQAMREGVEREQVRGQELARQWVRVMARQQRRRDERAVAEELIRNAGSDRYAKEQRFWALLAVLKPDMAKHPAYRVGPWLIRGVRSWLDSPTG